MELTFRNILLNEDNWQANFSDKDLPRWMTHDEDNHEGEDILYVIYSEEENDDIEYFFHKPNAEKYLNTLKEKDPDLYSDCKVVERWMDEDDVRRLNKNGAVKDSLRVPHEKRLDYRYK